MEETKRETLNETAFIGLLKKNLLFFLEKDSPTHKMFHT